ncbi:MAG: trimeric autotransporter adhesin [Actinomycetota bacterium]|nr:trimeric autotransporter adhesin [Actinomycetota bacterium]
MVVMIALGIAGSAAMVVATGQSARANYPDPPPEPGQIVPFGIESVPSLCPDTVPAGTVLLANTEARDVCDAAESLAPTAQAAAAIRYAFGKLGAEYDQSNRYSISPPVFDCSSFIARAYDAADATIRKGTASYTWGRSGGLLTYTGAYMPANYLGSNLTRVNSYAEMAPGDVIIQFEGSNPANSAGNDGHAQLYLGNGRVIQSGGWHPESLVNVDRARNLFSNAWFFRYDAAKAQDPVARKLAKLGGVLGTQVSPAETTANGATFTRYSQGLLVASPHVGVREVRGPILQKYLDLGREESTLGLPSSDQRTVGSTTVSYFQGGAIYWTPGTGSVPVYTDMLNRYRAIGGPASALRLAVAPEQDGSVPGTKVQNFQGGRMYWSTPTGGREVYGAILMRYAALGAEGSWLGLPTTGELPGPKAGSRVSHFQNGSIYWSPATGVVLTRGAIGSMYRSSGVGAVIGLPTASERPAAVAGAAVQDFQSGRILHSAATGTHAVYGAILMHYQAMGGEAGPLGLPTSSEIAGPIAGSRMTTFRNGVIYWSAATGPVVMMNGPIGDLYRTGSLGSALGVPTGVERAGATPGSRMQPFQKGRIYWSSATGAHEVYGGIFWHYNATGADAGPLGLPLTGETAGPVPKTRMVEFVNGTLYWSDGRAAVLWRDQLGNFYRSGAMWTSLGVPTAAVRDVPGVAGGRVQEFQRGRIYSSPATGMHEVYGGILGTYLALGGENSGLGLPTTGETAGLLPGTRMSVFQTGTIYWTSRGGFALTGAFDALYRKPGVASGLGNPTAGAFSGTVPGARIQFFANGRIYSSAATGTHEVYGRIFAAYLALGASNSALGLPTSGAYPIATGRATDFQRGRIEFDSARGTTRVLLN